MGCVSRGHTRRGHLRPPPPRRAVISPMARRSTGRRRPGDRWSFTHGGGRCGPRSGRSQAPARPREPGPSRLPPPEARRPPGPGSAPRSANGSSGTSATAYGARTRCGTSSAPRARPGPASRLRSELTYGLPLGAGATVLLMGVSMMWFPQATTLTRPSASSRSARAARSVPTALPGTLPRSVVRSFSGSIAGGSGGAGDGRMPRRVQQKPARTSTNQHQPANTSKYQHWAAELLAVH